MRLRSPSLFLTILGMLERWLTRVVRVETPRPSLVTGLHFQRSKLALIGSRGVEIMDLESMRSVSLSLPPPSFKLTEPPTRQHHDRPGPPSLAK